MQSGSPSVHSLLMYLEAVRGRLTAQKTKSDTHSDITKYVVAWARNLGQRHSARIVITLPNIPTMQNAIAQIAAINEVASGILDIFKSCTVCLGHYCTPISITNRGVVTSKKRWISKRLQLLEEADWLFVRFRYATLTIILSRVGWRSTIAIVIRYFETTMCYTITKYFVFQSRTRLMPAVYFDVYKNWNCVSR